MCFVLIGVASCMVLVMEGRQSKWVARLTNGEQQASQAPASAFEVGLSGLHARLHCTFTSSLP